MSAKTVKVGTLFNFSLEEGHDAAFDPQRPRTNAATFDIDLGNIVLNGARLTRYTQVDEKDDKLVHTYSVQSAPRFVEDPNGRSESTRYGADGDKTVKKGNWAPNYRVNDQYLYGALVSTACESYAKLVKATEEFGIDPILKPIAVMQVPREEFGDDIEKEVEELMG